MNRREILKKGILASALLPTTSIYDLKVKGKTGKDFSINSSDIHNFTVALFDKEGNPLTEHRPLKMYLAAGQIWKSKCVHFGKPQSTCWIDSLRIFLSEKEVYIHYFRKNELWCDRDTFTLNESSFTGICDGKLVPCGN